MELTTQTSNGITYMAISAATLTATGLVPSTAAGLGLKGILWYRGYVLSLTEVPLDDEDWYRQLTDTKLNDFLVWFNSVYDDKKTPELCNPPVAGAVFATFDLNPAAADTFWSQVVRFGVRFDETAPSSVLYQWLRAGLDLRGPAKPTPWQYFNGCGFAWNAFREGKPITEIQYRTKKRLMLIE